MLSCFYYFYNCSNGNCMSLLYIYLKYFECNGNWDWSWWRIHMSKQQNQKTKKKLKHRQFVYMTGWKKNDLLFYWMPLFILWCTSFSVIDYWNWWNDVKWRSRIPLASKWFNRVCIRRQNKWIISHTKNSTLNRHQAIDFINTPISIELSLFSE